MLKGGIEQISTIQFFSQMKLYLLSILAVTSRTFADHPPASPLDENDVIDEEPNGVIDFSQAVPQKDGSLCITKTKYIEKMEKQPVKECW